MIKKLIILVLLIMLPCCCSKWTITIGTIQSCDIAFTGDGIVSVIQVSDGELFGEWTAWGTVSCEVGDILYGTKIQCCCYKFRVRGISYRVVDDAEEQKLNALVEWKKDRSKARRMEEEMYDEY